MSDVTNPFCPIEPSSVAMITLVNSSSLIDKEQFCLCPCPQQERHNTIGPGKGKDRCCTDAPGNCKHFFTFDKTVPKRPAYTNPVANLQVDRALVASPTF